MPTVGPSLRRFIVIPALLSYTALVLYLFYYVGIGELIAIVEKINIWHLCFGNRQRGYVAYISRVGLVSAPPLSVDTVEFSQNLRPLLGRRVRRKPDSVRLVR